MFWYYSASHFDKCLLFTLMLLQKFLTCRYQGDYNVRCGNVSNVFDKLFCNNKYQIMKIKLRKISFYKSNSEKNYFPARYFPIFFLWNSSKGEVGLLQISQKLFFASCNNEMPLGVISPCLLKLPFLKPPTKRPSSPLQLARNRIN